MKRQGIEPGLIRVFQYFTVISILYFFVNLLYATLETGRSLAFPQIQAYWNMMSSIFLFIYLSLPWLQRKLKGIYLPLALSIVTGGLLLSNIVYFPLFFADNRSILEGGIINIFPILFVPLVIIAWQYDFKSVLIFVLVTAIADLLLVWAAVGKFTLDSLPVFSLPILRAFAFGTVGHIVCQIVEAQREQRKELVRANLRLLEHANTLEQLTLSRERNRLARELHDTLAHTLSGLAVNLEAIRLSVPENMQDVQEMLDHSLKNIRSGLADTRRALKDLRPQNLEDLGLVISLKKLLDDASLRSGMRMEIKIGENLPQLKTDEEQGIYRIAQEALENIIRHANAAEVKFSFCYQKPKLIMRIEDDGRGFILSLIHI
jgi:signal transduction histidine kinase